LLIVVFVFVVIDVEMLVLHVIAAFGLSLAYVLPVLKYFQDKMSYFCIAFADAFLTLAVISRGVSGKSFANNAR
jgi:hypothetical protein